MNRMFLLKNQSGDPLVQEGIGGGGFTLVELLVVIVIISILASMLLPVLARVKESGRRTTCLNNLKELGLSMRFYADDNYDYFPLRSGTARWPTSLREGYVNMQLMLCPSDRPNTPKTGSTDTNNYPADAAPRSYIINGWNDFFLSTLSAADFTAYMNGSSQSALKESSIPHPSDTITFGEKKNSSPHYYMDLLELGPDENFPGVLVGNDDSQLEQGRHSGGRGSNYAFADGSARYLKFWGSVGPLNLWCVLDGDRSSPNYAVSF